MNQTHQTPDKQKEDSNGLVVSYLAQRNLIGFAGMLLPLALAIDAKRKTAYFGIEPSISDYFYTNKGDLLVVFLCVIGVFLISYKGYHWQERALTILAALAGMGVAFVPTKMRCGDCVLSVHTGSGGVLPNIAGTWWHFLFAAVFLLSLAVMSLYFFRMSDDSGYLKTKAGRKSAKGRRNTVYTICGWIMVVSVAIIGVYLWFKPDVNDFPVVFAFETIAVEAFGISWITKGNSLWPDGEHYLVKTFRQLTRPSHKIPQGQPIAQPLKKSG
jgi:hypothetical protein